MAAIKFKNGAIGTVEGTTNVYHRNLEETLYIFGRNSSVKIGGTSTNNIDVWDFCHILKGARIGSNCSLGQNVNIGKDVNIGNGCKIQNNVSVYEGVELQDYVFCGPSIVSTNDLTPRAKYPKWHEDYKKTLLMEGTTVGANATIVCGHTLGKWSMIAAGAVVTINVKHHALMAGVSAKQMGWACECGAILKNNLTCHNCGRNYIEDDFGLKEKKWILHMMLIKSWWILSGNKDMKLQIIIITNPMIKLLF